LLGEVMALDADGFGAHGERLAQEGLDLPEQCRRLTAWAWGRTGRSGPAVVIGFGSLPYPAVRLGEGPLARRLAEAVEAARLKAQAASGESLRVIAFFPGISDMSFLGEADTAGVQLIAANTPAWASGVRWSGEVGAIPTVNIGPWGRDYHTPLERLHAPFAFEVLPALVLDTAKEALRREA
jgi:arginine utilization protein RocB